MPLSLRMREVLDDLKRLGEGSEHLMMLYADQQDLVETVRRRLQEEFLSICKEEDAYRRITHQS